MKTHILSLDALIERVDLQLYKPKTRPKHPSLKTRHDRRPLGEHYNWRHQISPSLDAIRAHTEREPHHRKRGNPIRKQGQSWATLALEKTRSGSRTTAHHCILRLCKIRQQPSANTRLVKPCDQNAATEDPSWSTTLAKRVAKLAQCHSS
jgi:hypothetical protein